jgi:hypothetical protein
MQLDSLIDPMIFYSVGSWQIMSEGHANVIMTYSVNKYADHVYEFLALLILLPYYSILNINNNKRYCDTA